MIPARSPVILVADDGPDFGLGHIRRLEYLHQVIEPSIRRKARLISRQTFPSSTVKDGSRRQFWQEVCDEFSALRPLLCVFDLSYSSWEPVWDRVAASIPSYAQSIGIDAPAGWRKRFDHVIHPGVAKSKIEESLGNWHGGPEWVLAERNPTWNPESGAPKLTVTTGSQAFESFHGWLSHHLCSLSDTGIEVEWVVGKHRENLIPWLNSQGRAIKYVSDTRLVERFTSSSAVLTRFGVTAFELTAKGVPTIILPGWTDSEAREVRELERSEVVLVARSESEVIQLVSRLAKDKELQLRLSRAARAYFQLPQQHPASRLVSQIVSEQTDG